MSVLFLLVILLIILVLVARIAGKRIRKESGIPFGKIAAADSSKFRSFQKVLFSRNVLLAGKPDTILVVEDEYVPIELKIRDPPKQPFDSHKMQVIAYCYLLEENGYRVSYGVLKYKKGKEERNFVVDYTPELKERLLAAISEMRSIKSIPSKIKSTKCEKCSVREYCEKLDGS